MMVGTYYSSSHQEMSCLFHCGQMQYPGSNQQHQIRGRQCIWKGYSLHIFDSAVLCKWPALVVWANNAGQGKKNGGILWMSLERPCICGFHGTLHDSVRTQIRSTSVKASLSRILRLFKVRDATKIIDIMKSEAECANGESVADNHSRLAPGRYLWRQISVDESLKL